MFFKLNLLDSGLGSNYLAFVHYQSHTLSHTHPAGINHCCSPCSCSLTVCSSPWPLTWAKISGQWSTQRWTSTCQLLQRCLPRSTDEVDMRDCRELCLMQYVRRCWWVRFVVIFMYVCFVIIKMWGENKTNFMFWNCLISFTYFIFWIEMV